MHLTGLLRLLRDHPTFQHQLEHLQNTDLAVNVIRSARPFVLAALTETWDGPILYLTARVKRTYDITGQLPVWLGDAAHITRFAEPAAKFYEWALWGESAIRHRLETLTALMPANDQVTQWPVVVTSARAVMQRTLPVNQFRRRSSMLKIGDRYVLDKLLADWIAIGYEATPIVIEPGSFSRRGGVIDIYPVAAEQPVRIEFFDDEIDSLRRFDPSTQRSEARVSEVYITPAREALPEHTPQLARHLGPYFDALGDDNESEVRRDAELLANGAAFPHLEHYLPYLYTHTASLLDYAPDNALIVIEDLDDFRSTVMSLQEQAEEDRAAGVEAGLLPDDYPQPYLDWTQFEEGLQDRRVLEFNLTADALNGLFTTGGRFGGQLKPALTHIRKRNGDGDRCVVVSQQVPRLTDIWYEQDTSAYIPNIQDITETPDEGALMFVNGVMQEGWSLNTGRKQTHIFTDAELFGWGRPEPRRSHRKKPVRRRDSDFADWRDGDYVVHIDYGVGQFAGMRHRTVAGVEREYLVVEYGGSDTLFVPIHQAARLTRYVGADDKPPKLSKLGQPEWSRVRSKAKKAIMEEATELLELYAQRARASGYAFAPDNHWQHELEASFPYIETDDQLRAASEVKVDMENPHPMDRLICGDVGYGKTEVALRAAFKAVMDGKQVAILVPTTILAQQHYETFASRLAPFPVVVELLSRFRSQYAQERIIPRLASGEIDVIIGTHRILSQDVQLKDLGLIIIDEEQRFGVKQKEHFKSLRKQIDVLTLTATPIPRTLYMSLTGVRDISMIQTPPEERLPVVTHTGAFDEHLVRQSVLRELERGGQVFVVHNRIRSIHMIREKLEDIVPEARIVTAHGQMAERQLESVMAAFGRGEFDVLLSTAIIENGIDIPNANTLIVDRADWFGLSQLYQLRGRVGRSAQQAYAYFFYPSGGKVTEEARQRLETLAENTSLGAGFQIAMRDLEIRGAGDILSTRQTGHVAAIGLHLYTQLLTQAVQQLKGKQSGEPTPVSATNSIVMDLPIPAYLPDDWIPEIALRLQIYRRIGNLSDQADIEAMREELRDRFGQLPEAVEGLLYQIEIKLLAQHSNATAILARDGRVQIKLPYLAEINRDAFAQNLGDDIAVTRTAIEVPMADDVWRLRLVDIMSTLAREATTSVGL